MTDNLLDILVEIVNSYDCTDDIETKLLEDIKEEIDLILYERATTINRLADMWDQGYGETED